MPVLQASSYNNQSSSPFSFLKEPRQVAADYFFSALRHVRYDYMHTKPQSNLQYSPIIKIKLFSSLATLDC